MASERGGTGSSAGTAGTSRRRRFDDAERGGKALPPRVWGGLCPQAKWTGTRAVGFRGIVLVDDSAREEYGDMPSLLLLIVSPVN